MPTTLTNAQITAALESLFGWTFQNDKITKTYQFGSFKEAMSFIVRLSYEAEALNHHPELFNVYSTVRIALNTHDAGGKVTAKDLDLAKTIEEISWV